MVAVVVVTCCIAHLHFTAGDHHLIAGNAGRIGVEFEQNK